MFIKLSDDKNDHVDEVSETPKDDEEINDAPQDDETPQDQSSEEEDN